MSEVAGSRPSCGVAMCVYNGARFLQAQLDSIAAQSQLPSCVAIVDDRSTDGSWAILERWAQAMPFEVKLHRNEANLGVVRNFEKAISLVDREIIFLADQDDVWRVGKLARMADVMMADPSIGLLHTDADLIDGGGTPLGRTLFQTLLVTPAELEAVASGEAWRAYSRRNLVTGAACAFRRELVAKAFPLSLDWVHDEWLAFTASMVSRVVLLEEVTMSYRLHGSNVVGIPITNLAWRIRSFARMMSQPAAAGQKVRAARLRQMQAHAEAIGADARICDYLAQAAGHAEFRAALPANPFARLSAVVAERRVGNYRRWSGGRAAVLRDIIVGR